MFRTMLSPFLVILLFPFPAEATSRLRRQNPNEVNAMNPLNPIDVRVQDDQKNLPLRCQSHADCGWSEYCGWHPREYKGKTMDSRCQACVGCVEPGAHRGNSQYFVAYGIPLAPVNGKCPDCDARAKVGKKAKSPEKAKVVKSIDPSFENLKKQKDMLERELEHVKGSIYDLRSEQQAKENALEDQIQRLQQKLEIKGSLPSTTTTTSTTTTKALVRAGPPSGPITYNTYNIYNTYNTQHQYNSNGHTFNTFTSCENVSATTPSPVPGQAFLLQRNPLGTLPPDVAAMQGGPPPPTALGLGLSNGTGMELPAPCIV